MEAEIFDSYTLADDVPACSEMSFQNGTPPATDMSGVVALTWRWSRHSKDYPLVSYRKLFLYARLTGAGWVNWSLGWMKILLREFSSPLLARLSMSKSFAIRIRGKKERTVYSTSIDGVANMPFFAHRNAGYCFVEFTNPDAANKALALNGSQVPNSSRSFKLNWASGGGLVDRR